MATVSGAGLVTSVAAGTAVISAVSSGLTAHTNLTVNAALVSIAVTPVGQSIPVNGTQQFTATGTYNDGSHANITAQVAWSSSSTSIAAVRGAGLATGIAAGTSSIQAALGGITGSTTLTVTPILASITVTSAASAIPINTSTQLTATGILSDGSAQDLTQSATWTSPGGFVSIDGNGLASGLALGTATVTATLGSIQGSASLDVIAPTLTSILISPDASSQPLGIAQPFTATGVFNNATTQNLVSATWGSSDPTIAAVDSSGLATTLAVGTVNISATSGLVTGSASFTVLPASLVSIALSPASPSIALGTTTPFTAVGTFTDGSTQTLSPVTWNSSDPTIASIDSNGLASSVALGGVTISATAASISGSTPLTVTAAVLSSIAVTPGSATIPAGITQQFAATGTFTDSSTQDLTSIAIWISSSASVATISNSGLATAVAAGSSTMTASIGSISGSGTLNVGAAVLQSISLSPLNATVGKGTTLQYTATGHYSDSSTQDLTALVAWTSSDSTVVSIDNAGLATNRKFGTVTITAALGSITSSTSLTVAVTTVTGIVVTPASPTVNVGQTQQFTATAHFSDGTTQDITASAHWSSSTVGVATINNGVSGGGLATAKAVGTSTITATFQGVSGTALLTVN